MLRWALAALLLAGAAQAQVVERKAGFGTARFEGPTDRYGHAIMGNLPEWSRLCLANAGQIACVDLPETSVFEDIEPRLVDLDGDQWMEVVVVESSTTGGAALAVYELEGGKLAKTATPEIGRRNRWLAPVGIADFDGDGRMDIAYVETPHLGKVLRVWSWDNGKLVERAAASGVTNHRIGEMFITGGVRDCGQGPEMIVADGSWGSVLAVRLEGDGLKARPLAAFSHQAVVKAMACE